MSKGCTEKDEMRCSFPVRPGLSYSRTLPSFSHCLIILTPILISKPDDKFGVANAGIADYPRKKELGAIRMSYRSPTVPDLVPGEKLGRSSVPVEVPNFSLRGVTLALTSSSR